MCGFTGFFGGEARFHREQRVLKEMTDAIRHRGPDDENYYSDDNYSVGFRRLSIIDAAGGAQPMRNEDGRLILTFNGEIYNYQALRAELIGLGHRFRSQTDSEVLLHGYEQYGADMLPRLRGMFAFVIYDRQRRELFGARDFFGIKPLYYGRMEDVFLFGSEIKSFLHHPRFVKELNERALEQYLSFQYSAERETFFRRVYKLEPAHCFTYSEAGGFTSKRYWLPGFDADESKDLEQWADTIESVFDDSIAAHKISDVEVGAFLSSGVDSSYTACSAGVDKTFTVGFDNGDHYNETDWAKALSERISVKNIRKIIGPEEYWAAFPQVQYHMDEPLADPAAVGLYFVSRTAAAHLKVVLSGEGADELFGGYGIYREPTSVGWYNKIPWPLRRFVGCIAALLPPVRGRNFLVRRGKTIEERYIGNAYIFTEQERKKLLKRPTDAVSPARFVKPWFDAVKEQDAATKMQFLDLNMWMVGDILLKADKMSMAHSLELRVPFLDRKVMEVAGRIPARYRIRGKTSKYAMRRAAARRLPAAWSEKKKLGFPVPIRIWLKEDRYCDMLREVFSSELAASFFHTERLMKLLRMHKAGKGGQSRKIWTIYTFLVWYEQYFTKT